MPRIKSYFIAKVALSILSLLIYYKYYSIALETDFLLRVDITSI